jgi:glycosyltransferase involved in cell wall biosynthesis
VKPAFLIPAYEPTPEFPKLVDELIALGAERIIVVDDGSRPEAAAIFGELESKGATVVRHAVNLGKGRALKTGLNRFLVDAKPGSPGVVTLDADGQHLPKDVMRVALELERDPASLHLGVRPFGGSVPLRSKVGNEVTRFVFGVLTNLWVRDTQTGLRGLPVALVPDLISVSGERYDYEIGVLLKCKEKRIPLKQHPIATIYVDDNRGSHFNPILDSMRIYFVLLRFVSSSVTTSLVDFAVFTLALSWFGSLGWSVFSGRAVASVYNFTVNRSLVFHSRSAFVPALLRYYALVATLGVLAYFLIRTISTHVGGNVLVLKASVEALLFFVSYVVQSTFVFRAEPAQPGSS